MDILFFGLFIALGFLFTGIGVLKEDGLATLFGGLILAIFGLVLMFTPLTTAYLSPAYSVANSTVCTYSYNTTNTVVAGIITSSNESEGQACTNGLASFDSNVVTNNVIPQTGSFPLQALLGGALFFIGAYVFYAGLSNTRKTFNW